MGSDGIQDVEFERRNLPGSTREEMFSWEIGPFDKLEGAFAAQEYLQHMIRRDPSALEELVTPPQRQDPAVWVLEHLRQLLVDLNDLVVMMSNECTDSTCPKMVASKWEFLCAAHNKPQDCSAIDYILHTLNGFTAVLNNKAFFPSRVRVPAKSKQFFQSIPRRICRVFAHVFYHHREIFDKFENKRFVCSRFVKLVQKFKLLPKQHIIIPIEELPLS